MSTTTTFYKKVGRKYVAVSEYDVEFTRALPIGAHLILVQPGTQSTRFNVDIDLAPMIAAGKFAEDAISEAISEAGKLRVTKAAITPKQREAYDAFIATMSHDESHYLSYGSAKDAAMAGVTAMMKEAEKMMQVPAVKKAYDNFMLLCKLTKENM